MDAYCVKCKAKRTMKDAVKTTVNGHASAKGVCAKCGTKMFCFLPKGSK